MSELENTALQNFHPIVRRWFASAFGRPTPPQVLGWPSIAAGRHTLILAPTGSGKTLAAFLWAINHVAEQHLAERLQPGVRILYVSPLKALNNDIERNLAFPLNGIQAEAERDGLNLPKIRVAVRTGDTPAHRRVSMVKHPPDILITTPESLYLMLTSKQARRTFETVQYIIVDEIHSLCGNKRGVHLSISLERLQQVASQEIIRIGLSATQRPLERVAAFLGGLHRDGDREIPRPVAIIDAGRKKSMDLLVECPVPDFTLLPQEGVWPLMYRQLLDHIHNHRTTLIFVNNRRQAERVAATLNQMLADPDAPQSINLHAVPRPTEPQNAPAAEHPLFVVQAYHGSMSRPARERMEADLKAGNLRALVATSSLELGIDIGSIDLVLQIQSPKGVARGLQRVGRSGHLVTATSKGRILPTHREDLVESAVVARAMIDHEVEETSIPENCLDVLAQQIVAMVSIEPWDVDALYDLLRQSYCYRSLPRPLYTGVLQMLSGRFAPGALRELRPRISWDKVNNLLRALPGSGLLAVTSGGTITDRGAYGVYLGDRKTKVGEVDEEFVFETRVGDTFVLGTNVWRVVEIDSSRLTVDHAPGQPARMPFWRGEGIGRSVELGNRVGAFRRMMAERLDSADLLPWLEREFPIDSRSAWNIQEYFRKQQATTGVIPHDRLLLVEGFRDEIGDPRLVVHSSLGRRVNNLLGIVLERMLHESTGVEPQMYANDDGILLRCPDVDALPLHLLDGLTPDRAERIVMEDLLQSPLFGGQFRQNAARALLMPRAAPGRRTPLWLQRLRAKDLLQVARQYDDFPIVIETIREVLNDILDYAAFARLVRAIAAGEITVRTALTDVPSPFAASLLFDFIAVYVYEWDQPRADTISRYLAVNRDLLAEIVDLDSLPGVIRPEAVTTVEHQLQHLADGTRVRSPEELMEILLRLGDLSEEEIIARCAGDGMAMLNALAADGRAVRVLFADGHRWVAGEEHELYAGRATDATLQRLFQRYIQHHGPVTSSELARRYGTTRERVDQLAHDITRESAILQGRFRPPGMPGADEPQWCYRPNVERIHRQTLSILRKEIRPSPMAQFTRFLLRWQHLTPTERLSGAEATRAVLEQLEGLSLPIDIWTRDIFPTRITSFEASSLDSPGSAHATVWVGAGHGKVMPVLRGSGGVLLNPEPPPAAGLAEPAKRILTFLSDHGASFLGDIRNGTKLSLAALNNGIAELFWDGWVTNDLFAEIMNLKKGVRSDDSSPFEPVQLILPRRNPVRARMVHTVRKALKQVPGWTGRWSLVRTPGVLGEPLSPEQRAADQAVLLLNRYGILAREFYRRESLVPWPQIAEELQAMEMRGEIRRGYFVDGLSGMQYALPAAVEELRQCVDDPREVTVVLNACDPVNPYGPGIELPHDTAQAHPPTVSRIPSNYMAFSAGAPAVWMEQFGSRIWMLGAADAGILRESVSGILVSLSAAIRPVNEITVEEINGVKAAESPYRDLLLAMGFRRERNQSLAYDGYR